MRLGLLGGTFNPPHIGHLVVAMCARDALSLDAVALVPARVPPHKLVPDDPGSEVRFELCSLAAAAEPGLEVRDDELRRPAPSYTVDTLRALHESGVDLTFIVGGDQALGLREWREPEAIRSLARIAVADRGDTSRETIRKRLGEWDVTFFDMPRLDVSSSLVRSRVAAGRPIRHLVPPAVADRIAERGLYRAEVTAS